MEFAAVIPEIGSVQGDVNTVFSPDERTEQSVAHRNPGVRSRQRKRKFYVPHDSFSVIIIYLFSNLLS
jgi:hypothetical protein